jgi:hypothetical protein
MKEKWFIAVLLENPERKFKSRKLRVWEKGKRISDNGIEGLMFEKRLFNKEIDSGESIKIPKRSNSFKMKYLSFLGIISYHCKSKCEK